MEIGIGEFARRSRLSLKALRLGTLVGWMAASLIAVKVESDRAAG